MTHTAADLIATLQLQPHPEGGHYREVYRSAAAVDHPEGAGRRAALTSIYYLLEAGDFSALHRVRSEEAWLLLAGGPLELALFDGSNRAEVIRLGHDLAAGERLQAVVPANVWQAARPAAGASFVLCACLVAPGFDFADFEMPPREELLRQYPEHGDFLREWTRA